MRPLLPSLLPAPATSQDPRPPQPASNSDWETSSDDAETYTYLRFAEYWTGETFEPR